MKAPTLKDFIGIEHSKLGFFQELQVKVEELKAAHRESESRRQELVATLDGITDIMMVLSEDSRIISANRVFKDLFGVSSPEGRYCYEFFTSQKESCQVCPARNCFTHGRACQDKGIFRLNGRNKHFEMVASPLPYREGTPSRVLVIKRDVTLAQKYQARYYQAEKMATLGLLAAGVAHEVNNPLAAVHGFAQGVKRRIPKLVGKVEAEVVDDLKEYCDTIIKECRRCRDIVQALLTFGRSAQDSFFALDLNAVVKNTLDLLHPLSKKRKNITINTLLDPDLPLIFGDEAQLMQVVFNLLKNSLEAIKKKGAIIITTGRVAEDQVVLTVEDNGCGIAPEHLFLLFDPFYTTKPQGKGTGLGLSICYNIIQEHRGEIRVLSEPGSGTCFVVQLPIKAERTNVELL